ncbi:MAG TPA: hypothetical protein VN622_13325 [Clostridia bacterium]|nr:hypothetical protein [Clostridia bacterium]
MAVPQKKPAPEPEDAGHVPMTEEFDSAKHTMPDAAPIIIALLFVAVVVGALAWIFRAQPAATGSIDEAFAVDVPNQSSSLATIQLTIKNATDKPITLRNINVTVRTESGEFSDDSASVTDLERYYRAFPDLQTHSIEGLSRDMKIPAGAQVSGSVLVGFPISKESFDRRRALIASVSIYDHRPVEFRR